MPDSVNGLAVPETLSAPLPAGPAVIVGATTMPLFWPFTSRTSTVAMTLPPAFMVWALSIMRIDTRGRRHDRHLGRLRGASGIGGGQRQIIGGIGIQIDRDGEAAGVGIGDARDLLRAACDLDRRAPLGKPGDGLGRDAGRRCDRSTVGAGGCGEQPTTRKISETRDNQTLRIITALLVKGFACRRTF